MVHEERAVRQSRQPVVEGVVEQLLFDLPALGHLPFELPVAVGELRGALDHALLQSFVQPFALGRPLGDVAHLAHAAPDGDEKEGVLEEDPSRVFEPAPVAHREYAVDRLRPEHSAQEVVGGHDDGGRDEHPPVPVEGKEGQRAEDVEMRLQTPPREVYEERRHQHLRGRDDVAGRVLARPQYGQHDGEEAQGAAEEDRDPDVDVSLTGRARPRLR